MTFSFCHPWQGVSNGGTSSNLFVCPIKERDRVLQVIKYSSEFSKMFLQRPAPPAPYIFATDHSLSALKHPSPVPRAEWETRLNLMLCHILAGLAIEVDFDVDVDLEMDVDLDIDNSLDTVARLMHVDQPAQ
jgi:hypothetical protein